MIPNCLTKDFIDLFPKDPRSSVALWFDSKAEFRALLDLIEERFAKEKFHLLALEPDKGHVALWLKWATELGLGAGAAHFVPLEDAGRAARWLGSGHQ